MKHERLHQFIENLPEQTRPSVIDKLLEHADEVEQTLKHLELIDQIEKMVELMEKCNGTSTPTPWHTATRSTALSP